MGTNNGMTPTLYRRRYIPDELIHLKNDKILYFDKDSIVTSWEVLTKRHSFTHGFSCYYIDKNIKVSKFLDDNNELVYWYCDIIHTEYDSEKNAYTFCDLLADVIVYPNYTFKVVDIDEIAVALEKDILSKDILIKLMKSLDALLNDIYSGKFTKYMDYINNYEKRANK